jgi:ssDNA-binding replication factor A large subunit
VHEVEGPEGLLAEMVLKAPRLSKRAKRLSEEHPDLRAQIVGVSDLVADGAVADVRARTLEVLVAIARHRQDGADLVYDSYILDIGGE